MQRRTLLQSIGTWFVYGKSRLSGQPTVFPGDHATTLQELAATVLPASLGKDGTDAVAKQFVGWVNGYRAGAEMQSGYGFTRLRYKPASPAQRYVEQLQQLASDALKQTDEPLRRRRIAQALELANVKDLPFSPDGVHVASDLMAFYFGSTEANDLAYGARVGKDKCRELKTSGDVPSPLKGTGSRATI
jgi:hypothetical protein